MKKKLVFRIKGKQLLHKLSNLSPLCPSGADRVLNIPYEDQSEYILVFRQTATNTQKENSVVLTPPGDYSMYWHYTTLVDRGLNLFAGNGIEKFLTETFGNKTVFGTFTVKPAR